MKTSLNRLSNSTATKNSRSISVLAGRLRESISAKLRNSAEYFPQIGENGKISPEKYTAVFLWFAGHQTSSFRDVADRFNISISCLHKIIKKMAVLISNMSPETIYWPNNTEKQEIEMSFREKGFPGVIGAIDGTHIKLDKPSEDPDSYINRKQYYSMQVSFSYKIQNCGIFSNSEFSQL